MCSAGMFHQTSGREDMQAATCKPRRNVELKLQMPNGQMASIWCTKDAKEEKVLDAVTAIMSI